MTFKKPIQPFLTGGCNVRDLGGHETVDGERVRKGVLYRSGVLSYLTPSDHCCLAKLQILTVVDLRRPDEIAEEPTEWPSPVRILSYPMDEQLAATQSGAVWLDATSVDEVRDVMRSTYASMQDWLAVPLRGIFDAILDEEMAVLFHCAAGKDRTGFCAAMVLGLIGVSEEVILQEYAFTDKAVDLKLFAETHRAARLGLADGNDRFAKMDPAARDALIRADPDYLRAAIDAVVERYDSIEGYAREKLGLTTEQIGIIRYQLLDD